MSASARRKDPRHRRTSPRQSLGTRRLRARQPIIAVLLGVVGFALLVAYSVIGTGGAVANATATKTVHVHKATLTQTGTCTGANATGAHFVITQILKADAPNTITVFFDDGSSANSTVTTKHKHESGYDIFYASGLKITDATAVVPVGWKGQFNLSHYLCGPPPSPTAPPSPSTSGGGSSSGGESSSSPLSGSAPAQGTSPFVPGPGETGDTAPASSPILKQGLLAGGLASLVAALGMSLQMLKRRGEHS